MKKTLIILVLITVIAYITKPSDAQCKSELSRKLREKVIEHNFTLINILTEKAIEMQIEVQDYIVCKIIKLKYLNKSTTIGYGAFGNTYYTGLKL